MMLLWLHLVGTVFSDELQCGKRCLTSKCYPKTGFRKKRMVGGTFSKPGELPWQIQINYNDGERNCGGSILNKYWILTASSCTSERKPESIYVGVGFLDHRTI